MATSIPVVDTASTPLSTTPPTSGASRPSIKFVLIWMLIGASIASLVFGGVLWYLLHSGRLSMRAASATRALPAALGTHLLVLDPLLANLADEGGSSYLRVSMTLQVEDAAAKKDSAKKGSNSGDDAMAAIRDTALTVLGKQTTEDLLAPDGKEHLKAELKQALAERDADLKVKQIFFTDYLVQR
jgi:flagellar protein FliL